MAQNSDIGWTNATWNPVCGCDLKSPGCTNCYAMRMAFRLEAMGQTKYAGLTVRRNGLPVWTGKIHCDESALIIPLRWKKPRKIFVNSMSDLFHDGVPFEFVDKVFAVMALCPQHTFQILTKRPERMAEYFSDLDRRRREWDLDEAEHEEFLIQNLFDDNENGDADDHDPIYHQALSWLNTYNARNLGWPLLNVWLGTSCENQKAADERIPHLLRCPAAVRFLSMEPLLGPVDISGFIWGRDRPCEQCPRDGDCDCGYDRRIEIKGESAIHWVIIGCESGPRRRPMKLEWAESLVEQCKVAGVACFVKQLEINGKVTTDINQFPEHLRVREYPKGQP